MPPGTRHPGFCCPGCKQVHEILNSKELEGFYALGGGEGRPVGAKARASRFEWLDLTLENAERREGPDASSLCSLDLDLQGIHCAACVWLIQELWRRREGALSIEVNPSLGRMRLRFDEERLDLRDFLVELEALGYPSAPASKGGRRTQRGLLWRLGVCSALSMNAMIFALSYYFGLDPSDPEVFALFRWLGFGLATLAVIIGGPVFFRAAFRSLGRRALHLDLPIALGMLLAYAGSVYWFFSKGDHSYFDTVTIFVTLMLAGRFLQERAIARNRDFLLANDGTEHIRSCRLVGERTETVPVEELRVGDTLLLAAGDLNPARSILMGTGRSFQLEWIYGESEPRDFEAGEEIPAGAFLAGKEAARVEVIEDGAAGSLAELLQKAPSQDPSEESTALAWLARIYVLLVLGLAAAGALLWAFLDPEQILPVVISILVVTCPCAIGIAIPLAYDFTMLQLRRVGIFVRRRRVLEQARELDRVFFDKTGTLTWGTLEARPLDEIPSEHRAVLYTMVASSRHPVAEAIRDLLEGDSEFLKGLQVEEHSGAGLRTTHCGSEYRIGSESFAGMLGRDGAFLGVRDAPARGTCFSKDGSVLVRFAIEESFRPSFEMELRRLRSEGIEIHVLSGDHADKVRTACKKLDLDPALCFGDLSPAEKAAYVRERDGGHGLMIGDGLNDGPAFEAASLAGTPALDRPVLPSKADFFYVGSGAASVRSVRYASRLLFRIVRANLWLALAYNALALLFCFLAVMTPLLCAILMPISSLLLIGHTTLRFRLAAPKDGTWT